MISRSKAIINGTTFAMRNVTSVRTSYDNRGRTVGIISLGLVVLMAALKLYFEVFVLVIFGGLFLLLSKPTYTVVIMTTNGKEFGGFRTTDRAEAQRIVDALNSAIEHVDSV